MGLFKNLFNRGKQGLFLQLPFDIKGVKHSDKYVNAFNLATTGRVDDYSVSLDNEVILEFGSEKAVHILYYGICDLSILMQPNNDGWTATEVYISRFESDNDLHKDRELLFLIPNMMANENISDDLIPLERSKVYKS